MKKGSYVVCTKTPTPDPMYGKIRIPKKGKPYTIRGIMVDDAGDMVVTLMEIRNQKFHYIDVIAEVHFKHFIFKELEVKTTVVREENKLEFVNN